MFRTCLVLLPLAIGLAGAKAQPAPLSVGSVPVTEDYTLCVWDMDDGLPSNFVGGIAQIPDGCLWLSTGALTRFDGVRFSVLPKKDTPGLGTSQVQDALFVARDGALWMGLDQQGGARRNGNHFEVILPRKRDVGSGGWVTSFAEDAEGGVCVALARG